MYAPNTRIIAVNNTIISETPDTIVIDVSTKTYPNRHIMLDRDVFESSTGRATALGCINVILADPNVGKILIARYIMGLTSADKCKVYHLDGECFNYTRENLGTVKGKVPKKNFKFDKVSPKRRKMLADVDRIQQGLSYKREDIKDPYAKARLDAEIEEYLEETEQSMEQIRIRQELEWINLTPISNQPNTWVTVADRAREMKKLYGDLVNTTKMSGIRWVDIPLKDRRVIEENG